MGKKKRDKLGFGVYPPKGFKNIGRPAPDIHQIEIRPNRNVLKLNWWIQKNFFFFVTIFNFCPIHDQLILKAGAEICKSLRYIRSGVSQPATSSVLFYSLLFFR